MFCKGKYPFLAPITKKPACSIHQQERNDGRRAGCRWSGPDWLPARMRRGSRYAPFAGAPAPPLRCSINRLVAPFPTWATRVCAVIVFASSQHRLQPDASITNPNRPPRKPCVLTRKPLLFSLPSFLPCRATVEPHSITPDS